MYGGGDGSLVLLGVNHARSLHEVGLTKRDLQQQLWELARLPQDHFAADFANMERAAGRGADGMLWRTEGRSAFISSSLAARGLRTSYIAAGLPQTRLIRG